MKAASSADTLPGYRAGQVPDGLIRCATCFSATTMKWSWGSYMMLHVLSFTTPKTTANQRIEEANGPNRNEELRRSKTLDLFRSLGSPGHPATPEFYQFL